ncbi:MAG: hypothetical protein Q9214_004028 [Letrouitia sp. 1 TL-2023]
MLTSPSLGTQEIGEVPCKVGDEYVILVDTPGFNDTVRSDIEILTTLAEWMKTSYDDNMLLSGIIYLHSISDSRMTRANIQNLRMFRKLCGDDNLNHVILATTKWGITPHEDALRREHDLTSEEGFWSIMKAAGSLARRFENSTESATALVEEILSKDAKFVPKIQREIIQGKKLVDTEAGADINEAIVKLQREHEKEKKALAEELERAKKDHIAPPLGPSYCTVMKSLLMCMCLDDRAFQEALRKERERLDAKMAEKAAEQSRLHMTANDALQLQIRKLEESQRELMARDAGDNDDEGKRGWRVIVPKVKQGFWHFSWRCRVCKGRLEYEGFMNCPQCAFRQENVY